MKHLLLKVTLIIFCCVFVISCAGGGSAGTGTGAGLTVEGLVLDIDSKPVSAARVTIKETGDSDISDSAGHFSIATSMVSGELTLEISSNGKSNTATITVNDGQGTLQITVKFNPLIEQTPATQLEVNAKIVGECDPYFENNRIIRQANPVSGALTCTAKVRVEGEGLPLAHAPIAIQYRACASNSPWVTTALGATMTGANLGTGQVTFTFEDDKKHCLYRILAPFDVKNQKPVVYEVHTITYQNFTKK